METYIQRQKYWYNNMFKSYYVVWKPYDTTAKGGLEQSLNRTMQYGNFRIPRAANIVITV